MNKNRNRMEMKEDTYILDCAIKALDHFHVPHEEYVILTSDGHCCIANCKDAEYKDAEYLKPFLGLSVNSIALYVANKLGKPTKYIKD